MGTRSDADGSDDAPALVYLSPPDIGTAERELVLEALDSGWIAPIGPHLDAFEAAVAEQTGRSHAVGLTSGTAALHLALLLAGVGPGDDVLVPSLTFVATANAVTYTGARPCFVDVDERSWNLDPDLLEIELRTRASEGRLPAAVVPVDLYGSCADYTRLEALCATYDVPLIEDAAEALGAAHGTRPAGAFGSSAALSFNGNKIITTSGGGMLLTDDAAAAERARHLATQARDPVPYYEHTDLGFNYRLSNVLAALGLAQLRSLDDKIARRREVIAHYRLTLGDLPGLSFPLDDDDSNAWMTVVLVDPDGFGADRDALYRWLLDARIEARPTWKPMHLQPLYRDHPMCGGIVAEQAWERGLCLPTGSGLLPDELDRVVDAVRSATR